MSTAPVMSIVDVSVHYEVAGQQIRALEGVSLDIHPGTSTSIVGRSGSGKSTLISILSLLRRPTVGQVLAQGQNASALSDAQLSQLRATLVGTVFQSFHLDPAFTAEGNVMLPWYFSAASSARQARARAGHLLDVMGIPELAKRYPGQMSGGQRQRVAIARALFADPPLLIADEPTGNLDEDTAGVVSDVLYSLPKKLSSAVVIVTHDLDIAAKAQNCISITHGRLSSSEPERPSPVVSGSEAIH
jgi:ABC-type lipoprotein export system ATPase subunit